jgi:hypothetical protein
MVQVLESLMAVTVENMAVVVALVELVQARCQQAVAVHWPI